ncbi:putative monooxygenase p33MONOX [Acipenser ruthenus]|uniref:putative monooxygenase p33MONOX n=1 Tax=Acipenser ruthenus TaxID=7906 RepID=UPI00145AF749|nr:putative monooxygenase p33MONOX [Acipenser ruthenus]
MASRPSGMPALESGGSEGMLESLSLPIGMNRRAFSYDDALDDLGPMTPPPSDISANILWKKPIIPERKYQHLSEVEENGQVLPPFHASDTASKPAVPVVKAKATSIIMNSLITKQTQESIQRFERQAGLTDTGYTPHKGLTAEETHYHRVAEAVHKLKMQSGESKEEKQTSSAQSTPSGTPQTSPKHKRRGWFSQGSTASLTGSEIASTNSSIDMGPVEGGTTEKWSLFGPRHVVQKSTTDPGGFALQSYRGAQKPTPMELMRAQATRLAEDPANLKPPRMDVPGMDVKRQAPRSHNLKPRDMNVLTPSGF